MGIVYIIHQVVEPHNHTTTYGIPYYSICLLLNIILTLMIVVRIVRHSREIRDAVGPLVRPNRLYETIVTILVESCALYAITFLLFAGPWCVGDGVQLVFSPILTQTQVRAASTTSSIHPPVFWISDHHGEQVIAPLLIILRAANHKALTSETIGSQDIGVIHLSQVMSTSDGSNDRPIEGAHDSCASISRRN